MQVIILHLDMNSFFATAEQQNNPAWRGLPLGVCEHLGGIIIAASIEAKRWGIKTGTPVWEARKLYPKIILTKTTPDIYRVYIKSVLAIAGDYTDKVEQASIDEMYLDVTKACNVRKVLSAQYTVDSAPYCDPFEEAVVIAKEIKRRMLTEAGDYLKCSIGIAENKLLAKIASDMQKPNGLVVVRSSPLCHSGIPALSPSSPECPESIPSHINGSRTFFTAGDIADAYPPKADQDRTLEKLPLILTKDDLYQRLKLTDIPGIGKRQEKNLQNLGIKTVLELKNYPLSMLVARFGINGYHLHQMGQLEGSWKPEVEKDEVIKSIGHMYTLPIEYREKKFFVPVLYKLCEMVAKRLRKNSLSGNIIHFYLRPVGNFTKKRRGVLSSEDQSLDNFDPEALEIADGVNDKNYEGFGESKKLGFYVSDGREIFLQCMPIFEKFSAGGGSAFGGKMPPGEFKLIGVTVAGLQPQTNQLSLFGYDERLRKITGALDKINSKYGDFTLCRVPVLSAKRAFRDSIGFGRIKELH